MKELFRPIPEMPGNLDGSLWEDNVDYGGRRLYVTQHFLRPARLVVRQANCQSSYFFVTNIVLFGKESK